jgi:hypothetical protein
MLMADTTTALTSLPAGSSTSLPAMVARASSALAEAKTAAEILDAKDMASVAYDTAKRAARLAKAKDAHDSLIAAAHRAQADALEIEATAKRRLADEYDAAQDRGEVATRADQNLLPEQKKVSVAEIGLTHKDVHEARQFRDAEVNDPGVTKRTLSELLDAGHEPTKARLREAVIHAAKLGSRFGKVAKASNPHFKPNPLNDEINWIVGRSREIAEIMERRSPSDLLRACDSDRGRNRLIDAVEAVHGHLSHFVEEVREHA